MIQQQFIVVRDTDSGKRFLRHEGCEHHWTPQKCEAMIYIKFDVADALAKKMNGKVEAA